MMTTTECLKITLHCVGVCVLSKELGACMLMMETISPCGFYCVALTKESSDLVSPLYEHTLLIARHPSPDGNALLDSFTGGACFVVQERVGCRYRLDATYEYKALVKRVTTLIGNTLFLDIDASYSGLRSGNDEKHLLNPLMSSATTIITTLYGYWDLTELEDCALLKKHLALYHTISERRYSGRAQKTLYERFWEAMALIPSQKLATEKAVTQLMAFAKQSDTYNKAALHNLFKNWKQYKAVASYFTHRSTSLIQTASLHKAFVAQPALLAKLWLMPCERRIALYTFYCGTLKRLVAATTNTKEQIAPQDLVKHTLFQQELSGCLYALLRHFAVTSTSGEAVTVMEALKYQLLTQCVIQRVEEQALHKTSGNKSTLDALSLSSVYWLYLALTASSAAARLTLPPDMLFNLETGGCGGDEGDSDSEDTVDVVDPWGCSLVDFGHFLAYFCGYIESARPEKWLIKKQQPPLMAKSNSVLFFLAPKPALLELDRRNAEHYHEFLAGKESVTLRFHGREPVHPLTWQREWLEFKETSPGTQQYQFLLFSPLELMHNEDLACMLPLFMADIFNTSILRESNDVFFVKRLVHYYSAHHSSDISLSLFHKNHCYKSAHFHTIPADAVKETVLVPQCHTFSLHGMQQLLRWCYFHRETVKRVVFLGSPFILPCLEHGAAFLDLLRAAAPLQIKPLLYAKETRAEEFSGMLKKFWRAPKNTSTEQERVLREGGCRVAFIMKSDAVFVRALLDESGRMPERQIYCLTDRHDGASPLAALIKKRVEGMKPQPGFNALSITLDNLCLYNCLPAYTASDVFVIGKKNLFALEKNHLLYLFMLLEKLYVIDDAESPLKGDFLQAMCDNFQERKRPNLRYSYIELDK